MNDKRKNSEIELSGNTKNLAMILIAIGVIALLVPVGGLVGGIFGFVGTIIGTVFGLIGGIIGIVMGLVGTIIGVVFGIVGAVFGIVFGTIIFWLPLLLIVIGAGMVMRRS